jgi:hypothetical protein
LRPHHTNEAIKFCETSTLAYWTIKWSKFFKGILIKTKFYLRLYLINRGGKTENCYSSNDLDNLINIIIV